MTDFRQLDERTWASPQITVQDVALARSQGVTLIVNNRPEGESEDQVAGPEIAEAARQSGMEYLAIPISHSGFTIEQVDAMSAAMSGEEGKLLAYCRSGTRSTFLWALCQARFGRDWDGVAANAHSAGYDISPIRPLFAKIALG